MTEAKVYALAGSDPGFYLVSEIPCEIGGTGFLMQRVGDKERVYQVRADEDPRNCDCTCKGFYRWAFCKHVILGLEIVTQRSSSNGQEVDQV